ncbi:MAG: thiol:disulfide interchange protein DsbA/DsbL [Deltaproteobacteria bacterium]|jgi:thiol:disulfide interchange protein DsbA|nr:thiol:disulfide interchange protein DsbA/DsbL [Deltaproteobacteria bacterium]
MFKKITTLTLAFGIMLAFFVALILPTPSVLAQVGVSQGQAQAPAAALPALEPPSEKNGGLKPILNPARLNDTDDKIEVVYFFWYGCRGCRETDQTTSMFLNSLPDDVRVEKLHVLFDNQPLWRIHGKLFYVLDELGVEKDLHTKLFATVQQQPHGPGGGSTYGLTTPESQETFVAANGISRAAFKTAYDSPQVKGRMERVIAFMNNSGIDGVPALIINGRYQYTLFEGPGFYQQAERLINLERERLSASKVSPPA